MSYLSAIVCLLALAALPAWGGAQKYEPLSASVKAQLSKAVADIPHARAAFADDPSVKAWLAEMSRRLERYIPDPVLRQRFLNTVHYEATRAGLDPGLVLAVIEVESGFRKYAVSPAAAMGFMQVMPFWVDLIGTREHNLFHLRTNLRYGCTILRHYLDIERGDLFRALGRYNGSLGKPEYPNLVYNAWRNHWAYDLTPTDFKGGKTRSAKDSTWGKPATLAGK